MQILVFLFHVWGLFAISTQKMDDDENAIIGEGPKVYWIPYESIKDDSVGKDQVYRHVVSKLMDDDIDVDMEKGIVWERHDGYELLHDDLDLRLNPYKHTDDWKETEKPIEIEILLFKNEFKVIAKETDHAVKMKSVSLKRSLRSIFQKHVCNYSFFRTSWQFSDTPEGYFSLSLIVDSGAVCHIGLGKSAFKLVNETYHLLIKTNKEGVYLAEIQPGFFVTVRESRTLNVEANLIGLPPLDKFGLMLTNGSDIENVIIGAIPEFFSSFKRSEYHILPPVFDVQINLLYHYYTVFKNLIIFIALVVAVVALYVVFKIGDKMAILSTFVFVVGLAVCTLLIVRGESNHFDTAGWIFAMLVAFAGFMLGGAVYRLSLAKSKIENSPLLGF